MGTFDVVIGILGLVDGIADTYMYLYNGRQTISVVGAIGGFVAFALQFENIMKLLV